LVSAVPDSGTANLIAESEKALKDARTVVKANRQNGIGIYDMTNPLIIQPFEVRFLSRRKPPDRWVIDLSKTDDSLIEPQKYYTIPNEEDRLFIPEEFVALFVNKGWKT
jgi:hypothetical protein